MPTIRISKESFFKLLGAKLEDEELREKLAMLGTDVDDITKDEIVIEIFPDRPDLLSDAGLARAMSTFLGITKGMKHYDVEESDYEVIVEPNLKDVRPYTACAVVEGLELDEKKLETIIQLQEKLHGTLCRNRKKAAIGIYPIEKIKFPITFKAMKVDEIKFVPLGHDKEVVGKELLNTEKGKEFGNLIEHLDSWPVFLDAAGQILSVPPIINSEHAGKVEVTTKDLFIECSGFDLDFVKKLLNIIVTTLADYGGKIKQVKVSYSYDSFTKKVVLPDLSPEEMEIDYEFINDWLGFDLSKAEINDLLMRMGFDVKDNLAYIPAYRTDILHMVDLAEEVAIAYGYYNIEEDKTIEASVGELDFKTYLSNKVATILTGLGFQEVMTYHLANDEKASTFLSEGEEFVVLENSINTFYNVMRPTLIPQLLDTFAINKTRKYPQQIFEIGRVFKVKENVIEENDELALAISNSRIGFLDLKKVVANLFLLLDLKVEYSKEDLPYFIPGRGAKILFENNLLGYIGEVHPRVLREFDIPNPVVIANINLDVLAEIMKEKVKEKV